LATAQELKSILNAHLKADVASMANDEVYRSGYWPTGFLPVDAVLGGGFAKGRFALVAGESATLKSLLGLGAIKQVQKRGGTAALIDVEHAFNPSWAEEIGVNLDDLILSRPETGESAIDQVEILIRNGIDFAVVDSIAALLPKAERDLMLSGKDNLQPARIAALMSPALRKLNSANKRSSVLWISQMRDTIGGMAFSPKTAVTGGKSIHYYVSQSLMLKKTGKITIDKNYYDGEKDAIDKQIIAQKFRVECNKSRFGQPFQIQHFVYDLINGKIDDSGYIIAQGLDLGVITRKGAWWTYTDTDDDGVVLEEYKAGSKDKFRELVQTTPAAYASLVSRVCKRYQLEEDVYVGNEVHLGAV
jgi:recombination protein RecA